MTLTEDFFNREDSGRGFKWELANHPRYTNPWTREQLNQVRDQILKNQEAVEQIRKHLKLLLTLYPKERDGGTRHDFSEEILLKKFLGEEKK